MRKEGWFVFVARRCTPNRSAATAKS